MQWSHHPLGEEMHSRNWGVRVGVGVYEWGGVSAHKDSLPGPNIGGAA